jgi:hypothetical protein
VKKAIKDFGMKLEKLCEAIIGDISDVCMNTEQEVSSKESFKDCIPSSPRSKNKEMWLNYISLIPLP